MMERDKDHFDVGPFTCRPSVIHASHIREYRESVVHDDRPLWLSVKQYTPKAQGRAGHGAVSIVAAVGNGFAKELYEPLFEDLYDALSRLGVTVRGIWIADPVQQGASATLNKGNLGRRGYFYDHSRDLLLMTEHFRDQIKPPIVGLGHSMGAAQILFTSLVLIEPIIWDAKDFVQGYKLMRAMSQRKEKYASYDEARKSITQSPMYARWDPRVRDRVLRYGFRAVGPPSPGANPDRDDALVETTTSPAAEVMYMFEMNRDGAGVASPDPQAITLQQREQVPVINPSDPWLFPLYRGENRDIYLRLPQLRPWTLFVDGSKSFISPRALGESRAARTGTGVGGSGGAKHGAVKHEVVEGGDHYLVFGKEQHVKAVAGAAARWIAGESRRWREVDERFRRRYPTEEARAEAAYIDEDLRKLLQSWDPRRQEEDQEKERSRLRNISKL